CLRLPDSRIHPAGQALTRATIHLVLHFLVPGVIAFVFFRKRFLIAWSVMCATMLVDVDHFLADPVYDPMRCSIGFHPLHQYPAIAAYAVAAFWPRLRLVAAGLLVHMALDALDCFWMQYD
ncbi:MAG: DUF6122 family protein, partial [Gammaproteobacteria bacterium]